MKTNQDIPTLLDIYERFGDNAQKALDFVNNNIEKSAAPAPLVSAVACDKRIPDGVYYLLKNGLYVSVGWVISPISPESISAIGIAHDGHYLSVPLNWNYGKSRLLEKDEYPKDEYCQKEIEAILDWDFVKHTNHLKELGLAIELKDGHYLPTLPVFGAMYHNREALNEALKYAGAEEIDFSECFWFAQRYNVYYAWFFSGSNRTLNVNNVYGAYQCGAVSLWEPKA